MSPYRMSKRLHDAVYHPSFAGYTSIHRKIIEESISKRKPVQGALSQCHCDYVTLLLEITCFTHTSCFFSAVCPAGSFGLNCALQCPRGYYGTKCLSQCDCSSIEICGPEKGCFNPRAVIEASGST